MSGTRAQASHATFENPGLLFGNHGLAFGIFVLKNPGQFSALLLFVRPATIQVGYRESRLALLHLIFLSVVRLSNTQFCIRCPTMSCRFFSILSHTLYQLNDFRKPTPPQNRKLIVDSVKVNNKLTIWWESCLFKTI